VNCGAQLQSVKLFRRHVPLFWQGELSQTATIVQLHLDRRIIVAIFIFYSGTCSSHGNLIK